MLDVGQARSLLSLQCALKACKDNGTLAMIVRGSDWEDAAEALIDFEDLIRDVVPVETKENNG